MTMTINGVGTGYFGKKNRRTYEAVCEYCHKPGQLEDYDTTYCFVVVFIPLLPLGRRRILAQCPRCTRHRYVSLRRWREIAQKAVDDGTAEVDANPTDLTVATKHLWQWTATGLGEQAELLAGLMEQRFADRCEAQLTLGAWYEQAGKREEMARAFEKALKLDGENIPARRANGVIAIRAGQVDRARQLLSFMEQDRSKCETKLMVTLAEAYQKHQMHEQALEVLHVAAEVRPELTKEKPFRKMVRASEKATLTPITMLPPQKLLTAGRRIALAAVGVAALAMFAVNRYQASHHKVYVANGLDTVVRVLVDGSEKLAVAPHSVAATHFGEGQTRAVVTTDGMEEEVAIAIDGSFPSRLFGSNETHVLNAFGAAPLIHESVPYWPLNKKTLDTGWGRLRIGERFIRLEKVDHVFEDLPAQIDLGTSPVKYRSHLALAPGSGMELVNGVLQSELASAADRAEFAASHLRANPDEKTVLFTYVNLAAEAGMQDRALELLAGRLEDRPLRVEWHRAYQGLAERGDGRTRVAEYYASLLEADPTDSMLLYLIARLEKSSRTAIVLADRAIAADESNPYPWLSRSFHLLCLGEFEEARDAQARAVLLAPEDTDQALLLFRCRFACGEYAALESELRAAMRDKPLDYMAQCQLLGVLAARGEWKLAESAVEDYERAIKKEMPQDEYQIGLLARMYLLELQGRYQAMITSGSALKHPGSFLDFKALLGAGRTAEAAEARSKLPPAYWQGDLLLYLAYSQAGASEQARASLDKALAAMRAGPGDEQIAAGMLANAGEVVVAEAIDLAMEGSSKAILLTALVQRGADRQLLGLAGKLNFSPEFPGALLAEHIKRLGPLESHEEPGPWAPSSAPAVGQDAP